MFLNELEEILDRIQSQHLGSSEVSLFARVSSCINSPHFQVSERAIYILNNDIIVRFVTGKRDVLVPILARSLLGNTPWMEEADNDHVVALVDQAMERVRQHSDQAGQDSVSPYPLSPLLLSPHSLHLGHASQGRVGHWNATIVELTGDIIKLLGEMEGGVIERMMEDREKDVEERVRRGEERVRMWAELRRRRMQWEAQRAAGGGREEDGGSDGGEAGMAVSSPEAAGGGVGGGGGGGDGGAMEQ